MQMIPNTHIYTKIINYCLFFSLFFLLCTKNFTVGVVIVLLITSLIYIAKNYKVITITKIDMLVITILSGYFIASLPIYIKDMDSTRYFKGSIRYVCFIPIYFFLKNEIQLPNISRKYLDLGIFIGSVGTITLAIYQHYILNIERVVGYLYSINFGYLACSLAFLSLALSKDSHFKLLLLLSFIFDTYATILTQTRGATFAIPILLILVAFFYKKDNQIKRIFYCTVSIVLFTSIIYVISPNFKERIHFTVNEFTNIYRGDITESVSSGVRLDLWYSAIQSFKESPLIGQSFKKREEMLSTLYKEKKIGPLAVGIKRAHAHNQYFEMLASYGILGIFAFILLLFFPLFFFLKRIYQTNYALTGFILVSGFVLFCMTEVPLEQNLISTYYGLMLVILIVFTNLDIKNNRIMQNSSNHSD
ncbi:O-antigen ligase family protein [Vibrio salinus]|uniref:O-antigen ligase family protein n=1 Tax=Vibrio salinus TaxID=2899784 RepID=UPI001E5F50BA|nr:O-antigen ligase family protein [Vibrio salinus]MCE0493756.1 O-antigen ligase family protein [Vibrio salinus]